MAEPPTATVNHNDAVTLLIATADSLRRYVVEQENHPTALSMAEAVELSICLVQKTTPMKPDA